MTRVSGAFDHYVLVKDRAPSRRVSIFLDDHHSTDYCPGKRKYISDYIRECLAKGKTRALVEAIPRVFADQYQLGYTSPHTKRLEALVQATQDTDARLKRIDVRPVFSSPDVSVATQFHLPLALLDCVPRAYQGRYLDSLADYWKQECRGSPPELARHFRRLQKQWVELYRETEKAGELKMSVRDWEEAGFSQQPNFHFLGVPFLSGEDWKTDEVLTRPRKYELLCDAIMVWHCCLHITRKLACHIHEFVVHMGAVHSLDLAYILERYYGYRTLKSQGGSRLDGGTRVDMDDFPNQNCVKLSR